MQEKMQYDCVGDLKEELNEAENLIFQGNEFVEAASHTFNCGYFLSLYCC